MAKIIPIDEHFQHFLSELKESFWGDLYGQTRQARQRFSNKSQRGAVNTILNHSGCNHFSAYRAFAMKCKLLLRSSLQESCSLAFLSVLSNCSAALASTGFANKYP